MDVKTYAAVTDVCARLAGRLSDDTLGVVRDQYAAGESDLAESTLLLNLEGEGVGITREEQDLIRSTLDDPGNPDLDDVPVIDAVPPLQYRFSPTGPAEAPDPSRADIVLSTDAPRHGGHRLRRAWREPLAGAHDAAAWVYVLQVAEGTDELSAYAGLSSRLWVALKEKWPLEVVVEGKQLPQYQAAALTAAHQIWSA
ncbi:hypothetical protein AB0H34_10010 [Saccharopolyspora shandongensis]|uniref:hypothetical protein n=1 Tax=Saccharopolyspora shandongensis TaxID=418495 RepID=UPI00340AC353